jgi:hypothetical protein
VDPVSAAYMRAVLSLPSMTEWYRDADEEQIE